MAESTASSSSKLRERMKVALLMLMSILLCLGFLEIVVRMIEPKEVMRYFYSQDDTILHHKFKPNATGRYKTTEFDTDYKINSLGLRDKEYSVHKPANTFRILMLGDSFTEGDGVYSNETFSKRLEEKLQSQPGPMKFEVINAGVGSYSSLLEYLYLKNYGLQLNPDLVILNFDLSDVYDDITYTPLARFDANGVPVGVSPSGEPEGLLKGPLASIKDWFKNNFRLYNFIRIRITPQLEMAKRQGNFNGDIHHDKYALIRETYVDADSNWALTHKYLLLTRDLLKEKGIDFWMTVYPYGLQIHPKEWKAGRDYWQFRQDTVYSTWPQERLEQWGTANGINVVNVCADFKRLSKTVFPLYLDNNGHWVAAGHQLVADVLYKRLLSYLPEKEVAASPAAL
ncbi:MAG: SGNH/GDSL hydrolase family protein [Bacteroidota bacterium]